MQICVIGGGYIGSGAASLWSKKGLHVTVTTRHLKRLESLSKAAQKCIIFKGTNEDELIPLVASNDLMLITIAPDNVEQYADAYLKVANLLKQVALGMNKPTRLIYTSSTSVYGDHHGLWVDETSPLNGKSEQARVLIETEEIYRSLGEIGWTVCILRLAEIYGPGREISLRVKQLADHTVPGNGDLYTNMIHQEDVVGGIDYAFRHEFEGIYNLADDDHPTRKELYDQVAEKHHLSPILWDPSLPGLRNDNKRVSNHKIKGEGFVLKYPHRLLD